MKLTAKQEAFAQAIADGLNHSDAYRHAYDAGGMKQVVIANEASLLIKNHDVAMMIGVLRDDAQARLALKQGWTQARFMEEAEANLRLGRFLGQAASANGALKLIGEATGLLAPATGSTDVKIEKVIIVLNHGNRKQAAIEATDTSVVDAEGVVVEDDDEQTSWDDLEQKR